ncbi:Peptide methionine sulfoxide reductase msrA [Monocercomonoides exilis]|uniref:Peptide methionine sulfoxide reductase msrA n=1 Tax=Monocercomonoides exilis TaxID=2049356 RepID=UPI00355A7EA1|nr:Peptide methionine sulfoxide reductase msrA [Monocercomonoides exilis]|eukprot:MONOS_14695.1-p1 / transcript=MONOS_14695.1 / gene=MONOS_14695 / organism=Monocercomonoides_exilis_PA203 / gene_product=Peptide methionine sulfoxide reductase msrA / transcript_product=Peptide methionine sulfoxide reductase msrA / location=Mono_scaffold01053:347-922(+) / protein_length=191 / sequence_SO=supercontig / SO=protein_coding / is_pseudo=false
MQDPFIHAVNGHAIAEVPHGMSEAYFAMGCYWGAESLFWKKEGVFSTAVGFCGGITKNPTYKEVCTGKTQHAETVRIVYDPEVISYSSLLKLFWENHDPTQGMRQHADIGSQYRSVIFYTTPEQQKLALETREIYQKALKDDHCERLITTEILPAQPFFFAHKEHQQYLFKNPDGYCSLAGTGVCLQVKRD